MSEEKLTNSNNMTVTLANTGDANAMFELGVCYCEGNGVEQDYDEGVKWIRKAAEAGHGIAKFNLGVCYEKGQGVERDYAEAIRWYRKAVQAGLPEAMGNLSLLLRRSYKR